MELPIANKKSTEFRPKQKKNKIHEGIYNDDELSAEKTKTNSRTQNCFVISRENGWAIEQQQTNKQKREKFPKQVGIGNTQSKKKKKP